MSETTEAYEPDHKKGLELLITGLIERFTWGGTMKNIFLSGGDFNDQGSVGRCVLPDTVPKGKQLILETVTGFYYGDGALIGAAFLTVNGLRFAFPWVQCSAPGPTFSDRRWYGFNHNVRIYINGPATLQFDADGGQGGGAPGYSELSGTYAVCGHLVDI